jgi:hypothetical protein
MNSIGPRNKVIRITDTGSVPMLHPKETSYCSLRHLSSRYGINICHLILTTLQGERIHWYTFGGAFVVLIVLIGGDSFGCPENWAHWPLISLAFSGLRVIGPIYRLDGNVDGLKLADISFTLMLQ